MTLSLIRFFRMLPVVLAFSLTATCAHAAATISVTDGSLSVFQTRDGGTLTLGYKITSSESASVYLSSKLTGPSAEIVKDMAPGSGLSTSVTAGTGWYYRDFRVNLPPRAATGLYDVTWTVNWNTSSSTSFTRTDCLTMQSPVSFRIPILMYHKIGPALYSQYWITSSTFRTQMASLKAYGYTAISSKDLMDIRAGLVSPPAKPIMLTFDGGYENLYTDGYPELLLNNHKFVLFLLTGTVGGDNSWDGDNNPVINFLTWDQVKALSESGLMDLQSHTVTHPDLTRATSTVLSQELLNSKADLQNRYGGSVESICYPYGSYNLTVERACRDAGYFLGFTAWGGIETNCSDKWALKRVPIYWDSTTDYDPSKPASFFFNQIGDTTLQVPGITINSVQYLDARTNTPIPNNELMWGQMVKVRVTATSSGPASDVIAGLLLDTDTNPDNGSVYDSHASSGDVSVSSWTGQRTFEWLWTASMGTPSVQHYANIFFRDRYYLLGFKKTGYQSAFRVKYNNWSVAGAKSATDDTWGVLQNLVVTAAFPGFFYVEDDSRSMGLRVEMAGHGLSVGSRVDAAGPVMTNSSGERCLEATAVKVNGNGSIEPIGMANSSIGGASYGSQGAIWEWRSVFDPETGETALSWTPMNGVNNTGLLVRTCGRVKSLDPGTQTVVIDDGSGVDLRCRWTGSSPIDPAWTYVAVTGISSCEMANGQPGRLLLIRDAQVFSLPNT